VGPVEVHSKVMVDEMENFDRVFQKDGKLRLLTTEDIRRAKEDRSRLAGDSASYIVYKLAGRGVDVVVDYFVADTGRHISITTSKDLETFVPLAASKKIYSFGQNDYDYFTAVALQGKNFTDGDKYVKISLEPGVQISRVEIRTQ
jgi:hypothetical protein